MFDLAQTIEVTVRLHLVWVLLACFGGIARYLYMFLRHRAKPNWPVMGAHMLVSAFAGYMVASMVALTESQWVYIAAGIGGYMGTEALDWLSRVLKTRFGGTAPLEATKPSQTETHYFEHDRDKPQ